MRRRAAGLVPPALLVSLLVAAVLLRLSPAPPPGPREPAEGDADGANATWDAALLAFTGRRRVSVPHPLGAHPAVSLFTCPPASPGEWPRFGRRAAPRAGACLCSGHAVVPLECWPQFDQEDLATPPPPPPPPPPPSRTPPLEKEPPPSPPRYNVLVISMDTARADMFPFNGRPPAFNSTGAQVRDLWRHVDHAVHPAHVFRRAFAGAPWTLPSHAALLTGVSAEAAGVFDDDHLLKVPQLGNHLGRDYCRAAYVTNFNLVPDAPFHSPILDTFDPDHPRVLAPLDVVKKRTFGWSASGAWDTYELLDTHQSAHAEATAQTFLAAHASGHAPTGPRPPRRGTLPPCAHNTSQPFFLFLHTNRCHEYQGAPEDDTKPAPTADSSWSAEYERRIAETDAAVAGLLDHVDFATTVVVLTSDHGEGFEPALGRVHHTGRVEQDLVHATLVVWHPLGRSPASAAARFVLHDAPVPSVSVVPSVLRWLGYGVPPYLIGPILPVLHDREPGATSVPIVAMDRNYAWISIADPDRHWRANIDRVAVKGTSEWRRAHPRAAAIDVRMTLAWPIKRITARIDATVSHMAFDIANDPDERHNLLDTSMLPPFSARRIRPELSKQLLLAIPACEPLTRLGYGAGRRTRGTRSRCREPHPARGPVRGRAEGNASATVRSIARLTSFLAANDIPAVAQAAQSCPEVARLWCARCPRARHGRPRTGAFLTRTLAGARRGHAAPLSGRRTGTRRATRHRE